MTTKDHGIEIEFHPSPHELIELYEFLSHQHLPYDNLVLQQFLVRLRVYLVLIEKINY